MKYIGRICATNREPGPRGIVGDARDGDLQLTSSLFSRKCGSPSPLNFIGRKVASKPRSLVHESIALGASVTYGLAEYSTL